MDHDGNNLYFEITCYPIKNISETVRINIEDDGCGIPKENMKKILECFFTTKSNGTGLGLCISKKYIDEHDGSEFLIESNEGKGTMIKINITASKLPEMI